MSFLGVLLFPCTPDKRLRSPARVRNARAHGRREEVQFLMDADCMTEHKKYGLLRDCQDIEDVVSWICK